tara:strand:+ start:145 stop:495 length:351 start_codon:yes stop_codon:yes gene_type:complete
MYAIYATPYLNTQNKCYYNIIIIEPQPSENIMNFVKQIKIPNLISNSGFNNVSTLDCVYAFKSIKNNSELMQLNELPDLFNLFNDNNLIIDTSLTKMIMKTGILQNNKRLLCYLKT